MRVGMSTLMTSSTARTLHCLISIRQHRDAGHEHRHFLHSFLPMSIEGITSQILFRIPLTKYNGTANDTETATQHLPTPCLTPLALSIMQGSAPTLTLHCRSPPTVIQSHHPMPPRAPTAPASKPHRPIIKQCTRQPWDILRRHHQPWTQHHLGHLDLSPGRYRCQII